MSPFSTGALVRNQNAFDDDFCVGRNEQIVAKSFRRNQAQRFAEIPADDIVLAHLERAAVAGPHVIGRMMAEHGGDGHLFVA